MNNDPKKLLEILFEINNPLIELEGNVAIDSEAYLEKTKELLQLSELYPELEDVFCEAAKDLTYIITEYGYLNDEMIAKVDDYFTNLIIQNPLSMKSQKIIHYYTLCEKNKDKDWQELSNIGENLRIINNDKNTKGYQKQKTKLFQQEFKILLQEITEPEKYFDRALKMGAFDFVPETIDQALDYLQLISLKGLQILLHETKRNNIKASTIKADELATILIQLHENSKQSCCDEDLKIISYKILTLLYNDLNKDNKTFVDNLARKNLDIDFIIKTKNPSNPIYKTCEKQLLTALRNPINSIDNKSLALYNLVKLGNKEIQNDIKTILSNKHANNNLKTIAIWAAGKYPETISIQKLIQIINPDTPLKIESASKTDYRLKELALNALIESKDKQSREVLDKITNSDSIFAKTASIYTDKIDGNYEKNAEYTLNSLLKSPKEKQEYLKLRNEFIKPVKNQLKPEDINWLDKTLIPFRSLLKLVVSNNSQLNITDDLISTNGLLGYRTPGSGFSDFSLGATMLDMSMPIDLQDQFINPFNGGFIFAHEWGHKILAHLRTEYPQEYKGFYELFSKAIESDTTLDTYAETSIDEYFAQVCEAYFSEVKSHKLSLFNDTHSNHISNTAHTLRRNNPEMYKYFDDLCNKFNKINITKQLNLCA